MKTHSDTCLKNVSKLLQYLSPYFRVCYFNDAPSSTQFDDNVWFYWFASQDFTILSFFSSLLVSQLGG